ncbi:rhodanese-like domain-containing protein [Tenacibaculum pacificus]|uniref:rhodanese-like domain-containing protein n=1 Tax=Tenacibaculum pacificus TaxID=3018314 RepID=UPI0022F3A244|nr:rhodanese-like domain-containing protein [Tenacibaculum pacificus]WBX73450.1 rhodanese-like domain-containing protein [Tenacibaculum pacificus]
MKKSFLFIVLIFTLITSCKSQTEEVQNISVNDLEVILKKNKNIQLLDVRTPGECSKGTIENALEINVKSADFENLALSKLDKSKPVYVYCKSGGRSKTASEILLKKGFQPYNVLGGYTAWSGKN